jgi:hypothetical protein
MHILEHLEPLQDHRLMIKPTTGRCDFMTSCIQKLDPFFTRIRINDDLNLNAFCEHDAGTDETIVRPCVLKTDSFENGKKYLVSELFSDDGVCFQNVQQVVFLLVENWKHIEKFVYEGEIIIPFLNGTYGKCVAVTSLWYEEPKINFWCLEKMEYPMEITPRKDGYLSYPHIVILNIPLT